MKWILAAVLLISASTSVFAQNTDKPTKEHPQSRRYTIIYGSSSWNNKSTQIDSAFLIIKDKKTGKLVQVELEETAPDSAEFKGSFQVILVDEGITPEVYIPPQAIRGDLDKFYQLIQSEKLDRKPTIIKRNRSENIIDVYDTKEQAQRAWAAYQEQRLANQGKSPNIPISPDAGIALEKTKALEIAKALQASQEADRIRLEQIEKQKIEQRIAEAAKLSAAAKKKLQNEAKILVDEGMKLYEGTQYREAEEKFKKASELDPENREFYFKYGVTLYKNYKFNEALVAFNVTPPNPKTDLEKNYYAGLCHYKLKELDRARTRFAKVSKSSDPVLAPSASFYEGVILFEQEKYEEAKKPFETVLDTSKDPKLDEQAEAYIEAIAEAMTWQKLRSKKWLISGTAGLMYDSNVLLASDAVNSQGASQKESDLRLVTMGDLTYKAMLTPKSSWDITAAANLTNSSKNELASADPWTYTLSAPYGHLLSGSKPRRLSVTPGFETLYMAVDGSSTKSNILNSMYLNFDYLIVNQPTWISIYSFGYRRDDSSLVSSIGDNDLDANKYNLSTTQTLLIGRKKKEALAGSFGLTYNDAKGKDRLYNRVDVGVTYGKPVWKTSSWATSLNYYLLDFPDATGSRTDNNLTLSTALAKPIKEWFTWGVVGSVSNNVSTQSDVYSYTRYTLMTTATFNTAF